MKDPRISLGVVLLCHDDLGLALRLARIWLDGGATLCIHIDRKAPAADAEQLVQALSDHPRVIFAPRRSCDWGRFSLVRATLLAAGLLLRRHPDLTHVYLASGRCLPLRAISELKAHLAGDPECDHIESVNAAETEWASRGLNLERFSLYFPFSWRRRRWLFDRSVAIQRRLGIRRVLPLGLAPHLGSQWWCLTSRTLRAILTDPQAGRMQRFFRQCWIPDEGYFQTMVRRHATRISSASLTLSQFDHEGRPLQFYDDHAKLLAQSRCFVARKIWPGAGELLAQFPKPASSSREPPRPRFIEAQIRPVLDRRQRGRAGLYMQSRFPRKDAENGKTAGPYAVFLGHSDVFSGFEPWLDGRIAADVHGHLLAPNFVEFAGRPPVGPGCLSANPQLRDRDARGFLSALIRISPRMQVFQFSVRDNQALNWFMATDPNAYIFAVTGTWLLPLLRSNLPFEKLRQRCLELQRIEQQQLDVLNSVWVKARVQLRDLPQFLAAPKDALHHALRQLDPLSPPLVDLPPMQDLTGLDQMLMRLRDSGLKPGINLDGLSLSVRQSPLRTAAE